MLEIQNLSAKYGNIEALHGVSLSVPDGEIIALLGANGAGKTTILNCISGLIRIHRGQIRFQGKTIDHMNSHTIVKSGISQVPEGRELFPEMNVIENLDIGAHVRRDRHSMAEDLERILGYFPRLSERSRQRAGTLSGGEQQMLLIGRALMARPKLLLFDEPSLGLAPVIVEHIFDFIRNLNQTENLTILLVEQNARLALSTSSHAYVLDNGEIVMAGPSAELADDDQVRKTYLGV